MSKLLSPAAEVAGVLQRCRADLDTAQHRVEEVRNEGLAALAQQAVLRGAIGCGT